MKKTALALLLILLMAMPLTAAAADGMIKVKSSYSVAETASRLENILKQKGMTIFAVINHAQGAAKVGIKLRDTRLIIFGNPKIGSLLMQSRQSVAVDLPQKALIWQDDKGGVWISYNDPEYLKARHQLSGCDKVIAKISKALAAISHKAASK